MGTIVGRTRKDGSKAFTAQIVIKKGGVIVHREAETFDRKQAANAWIVKREAELKRPDGLQQKEDPTLAAVIDRFIAESKNLVYSGTCHLPIPSRPMSRIKAVASAISWASCADHEPPARKSVGAKKTCEVESFRSMAALSRSASA